MGILGGRILVGIRGRRILVGIRGGRILVGIFDGSLKVFVFHQRDPVRLLVGYRGHISSCYFLCKHW